MDPRRNGLFAGLRGRDCCACERSGRRRRRNHGRLDIRLLACTPRHEDRHRKTPLDLAVPVHLGKVPGTRANTSKNQHALQVAGDLTRYWFDSNPIPANADPRYVAGGAVDQYVSGWLGVRISLPNGAPN